MSHESIAKMAKCSQKMIETIAKQVEDHFVPRKEFFVLSKSKIVDAKNFGLKVLVKLIKSAIILFSVPKLCSTSHEPYKIELNEVLFIMKTRLKIRI